MRRGVLIISLVLAAAPLTPASASAAVTLGETESSNTACAAPNFVDVQTAVGPGVQSYTVPAGSGVITAWQHHARGISGAQLKFKVLRPAGALVGPAPFTAVGQSVFQLVPDPQLYSFPVRIPVAAGDRIGLATGPNAATSPPACNVGSAVPADEVYEGPDFGTSGTLSPFNTFRLNISATLEPDADGDGFGDETQDKCKGKAGPNDGCPAKKKKKKCKKRKGKGKSSDAAAAKKKKCKRKKKKK